MTGGHTLNSKSLYGKTAGMLVSPAQSPHLLSRLHLRVGMIDSRILQMVWLGRADSRGTDISAVKPPAR